MAILHEARARAQGSVLLRMLFLGFLIMVLQVPILMIDETIDEREMTRGEAVTEVTNTWGGMQMLAGPILVVPYLERWRDDKGNELKATHHAFFQPERLKIGGDVQTEVRTRGIFDVPLYLAQLGIEGEFERPDFSEWQIQERDVLWDGAKLIVGLTYPRAIREQVELDWNGRAIPFEPGRDQASFLGGGVHVPGVFAGGAPKDASYKFTFRLVLGGSERFDVVPVGRDTEVSIRSPWPDPSFTGAYLPTQRDVKVDGFAALWKVPHLGRNYPQSWRDAEVADIGPAAFGVSFITPANAYAAAERSVKYELLFVFLTFLVFYLFELFYRLRIHPVQYLLVGFALCLFYLLQLALAEHVGFDVAYGVAALAVVGLIGGYCSVILGKRRMGVFVAGELAVLYGFLYVLLQVQDYALLVGTVGLFSVLAVVMYVTRKIDWYRVGAPVAPEPSAG